MNLSKKIENNNFIIPLLGAPGVRLNDSSLRENLQERKLQLDTLSRLVEKFEPDGILPFMDLTVELDSLGLPINFPENDNPSLAQHPIKNEKSLENLKEKWGGITGRMNTFIELMAAMEKKFDILKIGYVIGPFTMTGELMGVNELAENIILKPDFVNKLLDFSTKVIYQYTEALFESGADSVMVLDPTPVILSEARYKKFALKPFQKLLEKVDNKPLFLHICGNTTHLLTAMANSGAVGLSLDSEVDFKQVGEKIPEEVVLMGNLDPVKIFLNSSPTEVKEATKNLIEIMGDRNNFILSSGCDIPLNTSFENISAFLESGRKFWN